MQKKQLGGITISLLVLVNLLLWLVFPPPNDNRENYSNQYLAEMLSTSALILMSCGIVLTTRWRRLERYFGGLDKMYRVHRTIAIIVTFLLLGHFSIIATTSKSFSLAPSLGKIALVGLLLSILLALAPRLRYVRSYLRLPYQRWRFIHRFIGLFFLIGILHSYRIENVMQNSPPLHLYVRAISFSGAALYLYKELLEPLIKRGLPYRVVGVRRFNGSVVEVSMAPDKGKLRHRAGQFLFVRFPQTSELRESHPFTISSAPDEDQVRLTVKASGDFTKRLYDSIQEGNEARLDGGYGLFDYRSGGERQIWVAGGIGITPFLSWIRDLKRLDGAQVDFYYSTRSPDESLFLDEIEAAQAKHHSFQAHIIHTNVDGHLNVEKIATSSGPVAGKEVYICGPVPMTRALREQFIRQGVSAENIHYEEFSLR